MALIDFLSNKIVDFVIWHLFSKTYRNVPKPLHLLCHGYQRTSMACQTVWRQDLTGPLPGIVPYYPNDHVTTLKGPAWADLFTLLGKEADWLVLDLLLDRDVFVSVESGVGNYYQLSGTTLIRQAPWLYPG